MELTLKINYHTHIQKKYRIFVSDAALVFVALKIFFRKFGTLYSKIKHLQRAKDKLRTCFGWRWKSNNVPVTADKDWMSLKQSSFTCTSVNRIHCIYSSQ